MHVNTCRQRVINSKGRCIFDWKAQPPHNSTNLVRMGEDILWKPFKGWVSINHGTITMMTEV